MDAEIINHPPFSPDFHLFHPMKLLLGGQEFENDELKFIAINWLCSQDKTIDAAGINNLPVE